MRKLKFLLSFLLVIVGIGFFVGLVFAYGMYLFYTKELSTPELPAFSPTADWKQFKDPDGYFTIWIPSNWKDNLMGGNWTYNSDTTSTIPKNTITQFSDPLSSQMVSISVEEHEEQPQKEYCLLDTGNNAFNPNTTLAGLPASFDRLNEADWTLSTTKAFYQVTLATKPRQGGLPVLVDSKPEPVDYLAVAKDTFGVITGTYGLTVRKIVASFQPIPAVPKCKKYINP